MLANPGRRDGSPALRVHCPCRARHVAQREASTAATHAHSCWLHHSPGRGVRRAQFHQQHAARRTQQAGASRRLCCRHGAKGPQLLQLSPLCLVAAARPNSTAVGAVSRQSRGDEARRASPAVGAVRHCRRVRKLRWWVDDRVKGVGLKGDARSNGAPLPVALARGTFPHSSRHRCSGVNMVSFEKGSAGKPQHHHPRLISGWLCRLTSARPHDQAVGAGGGPAVHMLAAGRAVPWSATRRPHQPPKQRHRRSYNGS
jgi:hypothetical protein